MSKIDREERKSKRYQEDIQRTLRKSGPGILKSLVEQLERKVKDGDMKAIQLAASILRLTEQAPQVVVNNTNNNSAQAGIAIDGMNGPVTFERILKKHLAANQQRPGMAQAPSPKQIAEVRKSIPMAIFADELEQNPEEGVAIQSNRVPKIIDVEAEDNPF